MNKSNHLRNTRGDLAIIMVTQCYVDSTSVLCAAYFKDRAEHSILLNRGWKMALALCFQAVMAQL